ncbi:hypothetical protein D3C80_1504000 [compost metagenome]
MSSISPSRIATLAHPLSQMHSSRRADMTRRLSGASNSGTRIYTHTRRSKRAPLTKASTKLASGVVPISSRLNPSRPRRNRANIDSRARALAAVNARCWPMPIDSG